MQDRKQTDRKIEGYTDRRMERYKDRKIERQKDGKIIDGNKSDQIGWDGMGSDRIDR